MDANRSAIAQRIIDLKVGQTMPIRKPQWLAAIKSVNQSKTIQGALEIDEHKMTVTKTRPTYVEVVFNRFKKP